MTVTKQKVVLKFIQKTINNMKELKKQITETLIKYNLEPSNSLVNKLASLFTPKLAASIMASENIRKNPKPSSYYKAMSEKGLAKRWGK